MATTYDSGRNAQYGSGKNKRKNFGKISSIFADRMGFGKRARLAPVVDVQKVVNRTLKKRNISMPENKFHDVGFVGTAVNTAAAVTLLNGIASGDTASTRDGAKFRITKIEVTLQLILSATAAGGYDAGKVSVFVYKPANLTAPTMAAGVNTTTSCYWNNGTNPYPVLKNALAEDNFYIVKDFDYCLDANTALAGPAYQTDSCHLKVEVPVNRVVEYTNATTGVVADILKNSVWLGYVGSQAAGAGNTTMNGLCRVWFQDM